jgi:hypothetical protein
LNLNRIYETNNYDFNIAFRGNIFKCTTSRFGGEKLGRKLDKYGSNTKFQAVVIDTWNGNNKLKEGIYCYRITAGGHTSIKRIMVQN